EEISTGAGVSVRVADRHPAISRGEGDDNAHSAINASSWHQDPLMGEAIRPAL
ncbi:MAG: hypothetical protein QOC88_2749, partial [Mycobacterium sp.]|nr:hypothetical protein [Mycobacterium sp.]